MPTKPYITLGMLFVLLLATAALGEPTIADSRIESVTVYRGQALVTRVVTLPAEKGELQVVVEDLPAAVIGSSLAASADGAEGVTIRSVRYRSEALDQAPREDVAELDEQIKDTNHEIFANKQRLGLLDSKSAYLDKLATFITPTASTEMSKGVLNVETLGRITQMSFEARGDIVEQRIELTRRAADLQEELGLLQRRRTELAGSGQQAARQAVIFVFKDRSGAAAVHLKYLVNSASWSPAYNLRLNGDGSTVDVEYLAEVQQKSGEDWAGVRLTLSTATPQLNARNPLLGPLWVGLTAAADQPASADKYVKSKRLLLGGQRRAGEQFAAQSGEKGGNLELGWALNKAAADSQQLDLAADPAAVRAGRGRLRAMEEGLAVSYTLDGRMHLASRSDRQLIQINRLELPAATHYEATPLLTNYVHQLAELVNTSPMPLLGGPYSAYIGQEFVGKGRLPVVARGQNVTVGFGIDTQLRCSRELVEKSDEVSWGQRIQTFDYQLRLENFKDHPVTVRLYDRIPASKTEDIDITLGKVSDELSTDELYVRDLKDKGLLRWDIQLPANAAGAEARDVTYRFVMKFAKNKHLGRQAGNLLPVMKADYMMRMMMH
ncbi:hypothetical protein LCGC14_0181610 [marine sediment metagenome]|uniref:DUF4139 domain-containing protein n=1 Tax=marine sediment metagenome TaxID=412755 RepID=A0A0F9V5W4_9ZZZZ